MKKVLSILLAFVMLFSLVGCGEDSDTANGENNNANTNQEAEPVKKVNVRYKTEYPYLNLGEVNRGGVFDYPETYCYYVTKEGKLYENDVEIGSSVSSLGFRDSGDSLVNVLQQNNVISSYNTYDYKLEKLQDVQDVAVMINCNLALKNDGTIIAFDDYISESSIRDCLEWKDLVAISASEDHIVGLKSDGTVVATGSNYDGQCDVENWTDIVAIYAIQQRGHLTSSLTFGIKSDGTVVHTEQEIWCDEFNSGTIEPDSWTDIVALSIADNFAMGLKSDGTVVTCGQDLYGETKVSEWTDIVAIKAFRGISVGIKADGSVVSTGDDYLIDTYLKDVKLKVD